MSTLTLPFLIQRPVELVVNTLTILWVTEVVFFVLCGGEDVVSTVTSISDLVLVNERNTVNIRI